VLGVSVAGFVSSSTPPTTAIPSRAIFASTGSDGKQHLYALDLNIANSGAGGPTPQQITNLSVPASQAICAAGQLQSTLTDPTTLAVVVYVVTPTAGSQPGTQGYCGPGGGTYQLAHYTDSASTAPVTLSLPGGTTNFSALVNDGNFSPLYTANGTLGGVTLYDDSDQTLLFYSGESFSSGSTVLSGISEPTGIFSRTVLYGADFIPLGNVLFDATNGGVAGANRVSLVGNGTEATDVVFFVGSVASAVADANNLYFIGTPNSSSTAAIYKEPLSFGEVAPQLSTALQGISGAVGTTLVWSNGSALIFESEFDNAGAPSYTLSSVPTGSTSSSATTIAGPISGALATAFMAAPAAGAASTDLLFLTTNSAGSSISYSSSVMSATGTVQLTQTNTVLGSFNTSSTELDGDVWEVSGITDTGGGYGGGTLKQLDVATLTATSLTTTGGTAYVVPSNNIATLDGFTGTTTAVGQLLPLPPSTAGSIGLVMDTASHLIAPVQFNNSNVVLLAP